MELTGFLSIIGILLVLTFVLSYINFKILKLPTTIGVMFISMMLSLILLALGQAGFTGIEKYAHNLIGQVEFSTFLMVGLLGFLLFAGALHMNLDDLLEKKWEIVIFATVGVLTSTFIVGTVAFIVFNYLGLEISYIYSLLFGALISPTDPIAVLGILKRAKAPKNLETKIIGESLFNDGIGIVVFLTILGIATGESHFSLKEISFLFIEEVMGGAILGFVAGYIVYRMLKSIDNYQIETIGTLALVVGVYALATEIHFSGPIAIVTAGLLIGNHGRNLAMTEVTRTHLDNFWLLIDFILNAVLFVLIGFEILILQLSGLYIITGAISIVIVLIARFISIGLLVQFLKGLGRSFTQGVVRIMTWGGLRGGISIALALSIPAGPYRSMIITTTYVVVVFSILIQGLTIGNLTNRLINKPT